MAQLKLFMLLLGCKPAGRNTEQHDVFFGIAAQLRDLIPDIQAFWPEAAEKIHIDGWREVNTVGNYRVEVVAKETVVAQAEQLYFLNLGGYKPGEMEEFHYKIISVNKDISEAIQQAKQTTFFKHTSMDSAPAHVDDKYGVDVDDVFPVTDILPAHWKEKYRLQLTPVTAAEEDALQLGYFPLSKI
ncbi:DUF1543 domain-containing protein [Chitinophaga nivalis]|uniref:DUF1543 domain-containing protein n=1 Tax=Chitinophaga nivalis TaxID=2991709 RepID=A0ABT3IGB0_9BACT|nr:DUF1543 domain-containing protein [Chitinophaga nivalis]MCW3467323.1 DUF1543 domain-containing protein [Chitinophaga nivalis]MCW3482985.1 DUF1543 domain-containing protein [Chitinophaga nivalis]